VGLFFVIAYGALPILALVGSGSSPMALDRYRQQWTGQNWSWTVTIATGIILIVWIAVEVMFIVRLKVSLGSCRS